MGIWIVACGVALIALFFALIFNALNGKRWRCSAPDCDFWSWSEEEALGHAAKHGQHKPILD
ncbi:MAG: hypothetical protein J2P37_01895 [Ktedonobacteraceae bacterium]|nr:hypothetical protein [Ktedonobacteraceae bacterium]MBO0791695.1 hypothetical protein [Ktedonobacteraceae bacterium]